MPQNYITLSRSALYALVWTKPVTELAKEFGISDVALAKRCRSINIPLPPRGHWAKVTAGQTPKRTPLPKHRSTRYTDSTRESPLAEPTVTFIPRPPPPPAEPAIPPSPEEAALRARIDALAITPLDTLFQAHPAVLRTAVKLNHLKSREFTWPRGTRSGPILQVANVSDTQIDRALRVLDAVLRGAEAMGWRLKAPPPKEEPSYRGRGDWGPKPAAPPVVGQLLVEDEPLTLRIDERRRQFDHVPTESEIANKKAGRYVWAPRFDFEPSGELRLHLFDADSSLDRRTWKDTKAHPLETQTLKVLHGLLDRALELKRDREEQRLRDLARREHQRQQALDHERRIANEKLIQELERQAGAWNRAQLLRRYLRAARRSLGDRDVEFLSWAEHHVAGCFDSIRAACESGHGRPSEIDENETS